MQDLNSNSFEYHSNGFELGLGFRSARKNVEIKEKSLDRWEKNLAKLESPNLKQERKGFNMHVCCGKFQTNRIFYIAP